MSASTVVVAVNASLLRVKDKQVQLKILLRIV